MPKLPDESENLNTIEKNNINPCAYAPMAEDEV